MYFANSNAQQMQIQYKTSKTGEVDQSRVSFRAIGGILDFYFFLGGSADTVVQQYLSIIGKPTLPPFWSLGF